MKNRREFLKIFGMVTAAGAALTTVGVVAKAAPGAVNVETCVKTPKLVESYHSPVKQFIDINPKWIGRPEDDYGHWRNVWANLSGIETEAIKEAKERDFKMYGRVQTRAIGPDAAMQEKMVDNVFNKSPLFEYLKTTDAIDTDNTLTLTTTGTYNPDSVALDIYNDVDIDAIDAGPYDRTWATFKGDE